MKSFGRLKSGTYIVNFLFTRFLCSKKNKALGLVNETVKNFGKCIFEIYLRLT